MRALGFYGFAPLLAPLLVFLLVSGVVRAAPQEKSDTGGAISIQAENDLFGGGTDRHFTNGVRLSFFYPANRLPRVARALGAVLPFLPVSRSSRFMLALGQNIYTPDDISASALIPDDRPYAGWLFSELGIVAPAGHHVDSFVVSLGVIGPASLGGAVQRFWHAHVINAPRPQGWQNQLRNEPAVMLLYQREWRHLRLAGNSGLRVDFTPRVGGALGNVFTYLSAGGVARLGYNLSKHDSGPPRIRPSLPGSGFFTRPPMASAVICSPAARSARWRAIFFSTATPSGAAIRYPRNTWWPIFRPAWRLSSRCSARPRGSPTPSFTAPRNSTVRTAPTNSAPSVWGSPFNEPKTDRPASRDHGPAARPRRLPVGPRAELCHHRPLHPGRSL